MTRLRAALGSAVFFVLAPLVVAGFIPWWICRWRPGVEWWPQRVAGGILLTAGAAVLVDSFARFALQGLGTPAPVLPTRRLVVTGLYRYVRNPMYLAVLAAIMGQGLLFGSVPVLVYGVGVALCFQAFVLRYEERVLRRQFGAEYERYCAAVPRWRFRRPR